MKFNAFVIQENLCLPPYNGLFGVNYQMYIIIMVRWLVGWLVGRPEWHQTDDSKQKKELGRMVIWTKRTKLEKTCEQQQKINSNDGVGF